MTLTASEFRKSLPAQVRRHLAEPLTDFKHRSRFSLVQFWYDDDAFHYEVWPQRRYSVIEVGLHLEHRQSERNAFLHAHFDRHMVELADEIGELWLEKWDRGWHKLYRTLPFEGYRRELLEQAGEEMARLITALQPLLEEGLEQLENMTGGGLLLR